MNNFTNLTFKETKVFLPSEVSVFLNHASTYVATQIKRGHLKKESHYLELSKSEYELFLTENQEQHWLRGRMSNMKYLLTLAGFKRIYDHSGSHKDFPFDFAKKEMVVQKDIAEIKEKIYKGRRLITLKDIDEVHGRVTGTASRNFSKNKRRLIEGEDYFVINSQNNEIRGLEDLPNRGLVMLAESGYLMLVKSFTDDLAWDVQRRLVKTYFRAKEQHQQQPALPQTYQEALEHLLESVKREEAANKKIEIMKPKVESYDHIMNAENWQDMNEVSKVLKTGRNRLFTFLREHKVVMTDKPLPYQKYIEKGYFSVIDVEKNGRVYPKTIVSPTGLDFIIRLIGDNPPKQGFFDKVIDFFKTEDDEKTLLEQ